MARKSKYPTKVHANLVRKGGGFPTVTGRRPGETAAQAGTRIHEEIHKALDQDFATKDSGARREFDTGSRRDSRAGKGRFDLIPAGPLRLLAQLYERGAVKYGDSNWQKGQPLMSYVDSLLRHANELLAGEPTEDHLSSIAWNAFALQWTIGEIAAGRLPEKLDDRPPVDPRYIETPATGRKVK